MAQQNKGIITSKKFADENFDKRPKEIGMAKITWITNLDDEDEPATVQEAINHPVCGKQ